MDRAVADRRLGHPHQHRDEDAALQALVRLVAHPARLARGRRPDHHHGLGLRQLGRDQLGEVLARQDLAIPPHRPPAGLQRMGEPRGERPVLAGIADEHIGHAVWLTSARLVRSITAFGRGCAKLRTGAAEGSEHARPTELGRRRRPCSRRRREALAAEQETGDRPSSPTPRLSCAIWRRALGPIVGLLGRARPPRRLRALRPGSRAPAGAAVPRGHRRQSVPARRRRAEQPGPRRARPRRASSARTLDRPHRLGIGLAALALGALAAMYGYQARESDRLRRWLTMRGTAEVARLETFRAIARAAAAGGPATAAAGLALFCRHLFDDQRHWLVARAARHRLSSDRHQPLGRRRHRAHLPRRQRRADRELRARPELDGAGRRGRRRRHGLRPEPRGAAPRPRQRRPLREGGRRPRPAGDPAGRGRGRDRRRPPRGPARLRRRGHRPARGRAQAMARRRRPGRGGAGQAGRAPEGAGRPRPKSAGPTLVVAQPDRDSTR